MDFNQVLVKGLARNWFSWGSQHPCRTSEQTPDLVHYANSESTLYKAAGQAGSLRSIAVAKVLSPPDRACWATARQGRLPSSCYWPRDMIVGSGAAHGVQGESLRLLLSPVEILVLPVFISHVELRDPLTTFAVGLHQVSERAVANLAVRVLFREAVVDTGWLLDELSCIVCSMLCEYAAPFVCHSRPLSRDFMF